MSSSEDYKKESKEEFEAMLIQDIEKFFQGKSFNEEQKIKIRPILKQILIAKIIGNENVMDIDFLNNIAMKNNLPFTSFTSK